MEQLEGLIFQYVIKATCIKVRTMYGGKYTTEPCAVGVCYRTFVFGPIFNFERNKTLPESASGTFYTFYHSILSPLPYFIRFPPRRSPKPTYFAVDPTGAFRHFVHATLNGVDVLYIFIVLIFLVARPYRRSTWLFDLVTWRRGRFTKFERHHEWILL